VTAPRWWRSAATLYAVLIGFLAVQTAAGSAQHAHDAFVKYGQGNPTWLPWTLSGTFELLAVIATLEYRHRRRKWGDAAGVRFPLAVIVGSALLLTGVQLVTAQSTVLGWAFAAWPAVAFLVPVALIETRPRPAATARRKAAPPPVVPVPVPVPVLGQDPNPEDLEVPPGLQDRIAALTGEQRAVWDVLAATPGKLHPIGDIAAGLGWDRHKTRRVLLPLIGAELVHSARPGQYAARAWVRPVA
jgi:hypothetical protein